MVVIVGEIADYYSENWDNEDEEDKEEKPVTRKFIEILDRDIENLQALYNQQPFNSARNYFGTLIARMQSPISVDGLSVEEVSEVFMGYRLTS